MAFNFNFCWGFMFVYPRRMCCFPSSGLGEGADSQQHIWNTWDTLAKHCSPERTERTEKALWSSEFEKPHPSLLCHAARVDTVRKTLCSLCRSQSCRPGNCSSALCSLLAWAFLQPYETGTQPRRLSQIGFLLWLGGQSLENRPTPHNGTDMPGQSLCPA